MSTPHSNHRPTYLRPTTPIDRLRRVLLVLGVLLTLGAVTLVVYRHTLVGSFKSARADFEARVDLLKERSWDPAAQASMEQELEALQQVRQLHADGTLAFQSGQLGQAVHVVEGIEDLRRDFLNDETRLVDLMLSHACGRFGLDLTAQLVESPGLSSSLLERLQGTLDAAWDHRGADRAVAYEAELMLAGHAHVADMGLSERFYQWLHGPADQAAGLRLYAALYEAMHEPVLDVRTHLFESARVESPAFGVVSDFLIVNLQEVPLSHRLQTSSRRLLRIAIETRLGDQEGSMDPAAHDTDAIDAVTGGGLDRQSDSDGSMRLALPGALDILEAKLAESPRPNTAPPSFPLRLHLPPTL